MGPTWVLSNQDGPHEPCYQGRSSVSRKTRMCLLNNNASMVSYDEDTASYDIDLVCLVYPGFHTDGIDRI